MYAVYCGGDQINLTLTPIVQKYIYIKWPNLFILFLIPNFNPQTWGER